MMLRTFALAAIGLFARPATAVQAVSIDHRPVDCLVKGQHAEISACFEPAEAGSRASVVFRAKDDPYWYFLEMKPGPTCHVAVLPRPKGATKQIEYYIHFVSADSVQARTRRYRARVASESGCHAGAAAPAPVARGREPIPVFRVPAAPAVPRGFGTDGLTSATAASPLTATLAAEAEAEAALAQTERSHSRLVDYAPLAAVGAGLLVPGAYLGLRNDGVTWDPADHDHDTYTPARGDCDDNNVNVRPGGGFEVVYEPPFYGAFDCGTTNASQAQITVQSHTCEEISVQSLHRTAEMTGVTCPSPFVSEDLPLAATSVPSGRSIIIYSGTPAGTASPFCCPGGPCQVGGCSVNERVTVVTSAGTKETTNMYLVENASGTSCRRCD